MLEFAVLDIVFEILLLAGSFKKNLILFSFQQLDDGRSFNAVMRFDTEVELAYFRHGGILHYMIRNMLESSEPATANL